MKKYTVTDKTWVVNRYCTLHRIRAEIDIPEYRVKAGDLGGWIEKESNLSHEGSAWIGNSAKVYGGALISENAWVGDSAIIRGHAIVRGHARVYDDAKIFGKARIIDNAEVFGFAVVRDTSIIMEEAIICGEARIYENAVVGGRSHILEKSRVHGNVGICCDDCDYINVDISTYDELDEYELFHQPRRL